MEDAFEEHPDDLEDAEEESAEHDPVVDVPPVEPAPLVDIPRLEPAPLQPLQRKPVLHMNSSASIASDATTVLLGGTPRTPEPKVLQQSPGALVGPITPSPPSLPAPTRLVYREVVYVPDSPRKLIKAEPRDEADEPGHPAPPEPEGMDKLADARRELALLEAYMAKDRSNKPEAKESEKPEAKESDKPEALESDKPEALESDKPKALESGEITPTEPDEEVDEEVPKPGQATPEMSKEAAMREMALLEAQLCLGRFGYDRMVCMSEANRFLDRSFRLHDCNIRLQLQSSGAGDCSTGVCSLYAMQRWFSICIQNACIICI